MQFCSECHNMYYLKIQDEDGVIGNTLIYYCRNCGHEDKTLSTTNICVSDIQLRTSEKKYTHIVNEYTKYDPTLPRINTIKCPNQECISNGNSMKGVAGGTGKEEGLVKKTARISKAATGTKKRAQKDAKTADTQTALNSVNQSVINAHASAAQAEAILAIAEANLAEEETNAEPKTNNREVIYIRYDDTNMKYVYLCAHCDTTWRTDNRL